MQYRVGSARENQVRFERELSEHKAALDKIEATLRASRIRERVVKGLIWGIGLFIAYWCWKIDWPVVSVFVASIAVLWGLEYESSETKDLVSSRRSHMDDLNYLHEKKDRNEKEIASLGKLGETEAA